MIQPLNALQIERAFFTFLKSCSSIIPPLILPYYFLNLRTILLISKLRSKLKSTYPAINIMIY